MATSKKDLECVIAMSVDEIENIQEILKEVIGDVIDIDVEGAYEGEEKMEVLKKLTRSIRLLKNVEVVVHSER